MRRILPFVLLLMAAVLLASQLRSLFVFPEPNSLRWFGDETWLMTEATQQITTGVVRYPLAIGSQLEHGKGVVLGMTWLSAVLYGLPAWIADHDPVAVGRSVTAVLAVLLLISLYVSSRMLGASRMASAIAVLLLISTRSFFFASHSARPDLLAGMIVLLAVAIGVKYSERIPIIAHSQLWWFVYGAVFLFLAVSSSIHLLTLLAPLALVFYFWFTQSGSRIRPALISVAGMMSMLGVLIFVYYLANGSLELFPKSASQFHDVLHSIPILRPFSRSVQVANIVTRMKQIIAEAPVVLLLPLIVPFVWRRGDRHTLAIASILAGLSWLLLEGSEVNYLIHVLPLMFLGFAIALSRLTERWDHVWIPFMAIAIVVFIFGWRDSERAFVNGSAIEASNKEAAKIIEARITSTWLNSAKPHVLTEPPMLDRLSHDTSIQIMTDHFLSFPLRIEPLDSFFAREHVNYAVLYNSQSYPKDRPRDDPFYQGVARSGQLITRYIGESGDVGRGYFDHSNWRDTVLLFKLDVQKQIPQ
ncbi:MAG: hypothetical protein ACHQNE_06125 [Candidatus Kapaibacterium sp.]